MVKVLDIVSRYDTSADGERLHAYLGSAFLRGDNLTLSFDGVDGVPSSFVNASLVQLTDELGRDRVRARLKIVDCTPQVADMLRRCLKAPQKRLEAA